MSDDIRPGDVVVGVPESENWCGCDGPFDPADDFPRAGEYYRVAAVTGPQGSCIGGIIVVDDPIPDTDICIGRFRKVDASGTEMAKRIKACKPIMQPAICELPRVETQPRRLTNRDAWPPEVWDEMQRIYRGDAS